MNKSVRLEQRNPVRDLWKWLQGINPSVFLFAGALLAIILANSGLQGAYFTFLNAPINLQIGDYLFFQHKGVPMTLAEFINDALMAFFFFSVGLEIKREMTIGSLSSFRKAMLPVIAALGGIIVPVLIFCAIENSDPIAMRGMAIPMATDIAFALAIVGLLGNRVPATLKVFLMALAVVDDIGGILVIAIFYSSGISLAPLVLGFLTLLLSYFLGKGGVVRSSIYYVLFFIVWSFFLHSGIHTTIAGVLLALTIPHKPTIRPRELLEDVEDLNWNMTKVLSDDYVDQDFLEEHQIENILRIEKRLHRTISPVQVMEHEVNPLVNYVVLPLFAFANAGITFGGVTTDQLWGLPLAVALGLLLGKTLGIFGFTYLFSKLKVIRLTPGMTYRNVFGISIMGGIGFTVSLFIATLAYQGLGEIGEIYLNQAKLGIIAGTVLAAIIGLVVLSRILQWEKKHNMGAYSQEYIDYIDNAPIQE